MIYGKQKVYITVKTYPTISHKYAELVCTAGILEDGSWIRLYPLPYRLLKDDQQYPKYAWMEVNVEKNSSDFRRESYRPDLNSIRVIDKPKKPDWAERRRIILQNGTVYTNMKEIIDKAQSDKKMSLATFKPTKVLDVISEPQTPEWDPKKLESLKAQARQMSLFQTEDEIKEEFRVVQKIPYKFSYRFEDDMGTVRELMIEDWEIGMLYLNCKSRYGDDKVAIEKVKQKYLDEFSKRDLYFFLGTTLANHNIAKNPYIIIGAFCPPKLPENNQISLF